LRPPQRRSNWPRRNSDRAISDIALHGAVADSATSIALADACAIASISSSRAKSWWCPRRSSAKRCQQSGFPCNGLLDDQQARQLARFLQVHAYVTGTFEKNGSNLAAMSR